jgi:hypothetical protein
MSKAYIQPVKGQAMPAAFYPPVWMGFELPKQSL